MFYKANCGPGIIKEYLAKNVEWRSHDFCQNNLALIFAVPKQFGTDLRGAKTIWH